MRSTVQKQKEMEYLQWIHFFLCGHHQSFHIVSLANLAVLVNGLASGGWGVVSRSGGVTSARAVHNVK